MAGSIDRAALDRSVALGRARGEPTAEAFRAALPLDRMSVDTMVPSVSCGRP